MIGNKIGIQYQGIKATFAPFYSTVVQYLTARMLDLSGFMYWLDGKGVETRTIQPGRAYLGDGVATIDFGATLASTTITYFNGTIEDTIATDVNGVLTIPDGVYFGNAYVKSGATYLHFWQCSEGSVDQCFDSVSTAHGTIVDATLSTFHATNPNFISKLNDDGWSVNVQTTQETLQVGDMENGTTAYPTFLSNGRYGFSVVGDNASEYRAGTGDEIVITDTFKYLIEFDLLLNSGNAPSVQLRNNISGGTPRSNTIVSVNGRNSFILTATGTTTGALQFSNNSSATDYTISNLTIFQLSPEGALIPLKYDSNGVATAFDIFGNVPTHLGRVKYNTLMGQNYCLNSSGTNEVVTFTDAAVENITDVEIRYYNSGWQTVNDTVVGSTSITGLWRVNGTTFELFSDGTNFFTDKIDYCICTDVSGNKIIYTTISEGTGSALLYNKADTFNGTLTNFNTANDWVQDDGATAWNTEYGFDKWEVDAIPSTYNYIPFDNNGASILTEGDDYAGHTWVSTNPPISGKVFMNGSETELLFPEAPALQQLDAANVLFDVNGNAQYVTFDEVKTLTNPIFFRENGINLEELTIYEEALTGADLTTANNYF